MWKPGLLALALVGFGNPASAASCSAEIETFARQHNLTATLPRPDAPATAEPRNGSPGARLGPSGGVLAPPEGGRTAVIEPPSTDSTPAPPSVPPHSAEGPSGSTGALNAARRAQVQTHLNAAREADGRGDERACFERLGRARAAAQ